MTAGAAPDRGDIVWIQVGPTSGHEQDGHRPALVLSPRTYNEKVGLAIMAPVTSRVKGYPFEVTLPETGPVTGVVLADQARSLDWRARDARVVGQAPSRVTEDVLARLGALLAP